MSFDLIFKSIDNDPLILLPITLAVHIFLWPNEVPLTPPKPSLDLYITTGIPLAFELSVPS